MKRAIVTAAAAALVLTGCSSGSPEAKKYNDVNDLRAAIDSAGVQCKWRAPNVYPARVQGMYFCTDDNGAKSYVVNYESTEDMYARLDMYIGDVHWQEDITAIAVGNEWTVECTNEKACKPFVQALGGDMRLAPEFKPSGE